ncbi:aldose epimerase [Acetobacteraceae bacterium H6797]|nr:aldose epimerase [Acetobacteraceae bacterium H6797]
MITLENGGWRAEILPEEGAAFATIAHRGLPVLNPLPPGRDPNATPAGAFLMLPWTNRLDEGRMGEVANFPINRVAERTAIHGLSRAEPWKVKEAGPGHAVLTQRLAAPETPYRYAARLAVTLAEEALSLDLSLTSESDIPLPFGIGWHPWFHREPGTQFELAATHRLTADERVLPIAAEPVTGMRGSVEEFIGRDAHHAGWDGLAWLRWPGRPPMRLTADGAMGRNLHVFVPGFAPAICLEPVSHVPDVINRPALAPFGAMTRLGPGETLRGSVRLEITD